MSEAPPNPPRKGGLLILLNFNRFFSGYLKVSPSGGDLEGALQLQFLNYNFN